MYSGKSTYLLHELSADAAIGLKTLYINHNLDNRTQEAFSTHNPLIKLETDIQNMKFIKTDKLSSIDVSNFDVLALDEAQFHQDLFINVKKWVEVDNKKVIVAGLDGDSNRNKFGHILDLIPICDTIVKLHPYCKPCSSNTPRVLVKAPFTHRVLHSTETILVGGSEYYQPVCRSCYLKLNFPVKESCASGMNEVNGAKLNS